MTSTGTDGAGLFTKTVTLLTQAATRSPADGTPRDFADFLTHVLAATAANVGGPKRLLAANEGRPGSWEAAHLNELLRGTIGDDDTDWLWFRTAPLTIRLNVAQLIEDDLTHPGLMGLDEALETRGGRYESTTADADLDAWDDDIEATTARYTAEYQLYAERFTAAARAYAQQLSGLTVRVEVYAATDPGNPRNLRTPRLFSSK